jgi:hypothetical protein
MRMRDARKEVIFGELLGLGAGKLEKWRAAGVI